MIRELPQTRFPLIDPLLVSPLLGIEARAVVAGNNPGRIFVDSAENPRSALVFSLGIEGFYLLGDPGNHPFIDALDSFVSGPITTLAAEWNLEWFEVSGGSEEWNPAMEKAFAGRALNRSTQLIYRLPADSTDPTPTRDRDIRRIDAPLLSSPDLENLGFIQAKIDQFWTSTDAFLTCGIGFCAVHENSVASLCISAFVADRVHVIDIETLESCRRLDLGHRVGSAFVDCCAQSHLRPHWDCMQVNIPSASLAEKLGFAKTTEYALYGFPL